ncbi:hypothetical protein JW865_02590 [Candidatus Bathyarchaeota archaeon]|nr:hypothetical protein [Candidatus Bathyarchaeota archaeon]
MTVVMIRCPNCGSNEVTTTSQDQYYCRSCGTSFHFIRPDIQKQDVVTHNCPICGKPIQPGTGIKCMRCGKYDLCEDCVSLLNPGGYVCKSCLLAANEACTLCGKYAFITCRSCLEREAKGEKDETLPISKACGDCYDTFFTDYRCLIEAKGGMPPKWGKVSYHCPKCGQICNDCIEEKKQFLRGIIIKCKNCGSTVQIREEAMP